MVARKKAESNTPALPAFTVPDNMHLFLQESEANLPEQEADLVHELKNTMGLEVFAYIRSGQLIRKLRDTVAHGQFLTTLTELGFKEKNARNRMSVADKIFSLQISNAPPLVELGSTKLLEIIKWQDDEIVDFFNGEEVNGITIDQAKDMSKRDLIAEIKANKDETKALLEKNKTLTTELEDTQDMLDDANALLDRKNILGDWGELTNLIRTESAALSEQAMISLNDLGRVFNKLSNGRDDLDDSQINASVTALMHSVKGIQASSNHLMTSIVEHFGQQEEWLEQENIIPLSKNELEQIFAKRRLFMNDRENDRIERAKKREAQKAPSRGRPRTNFDEEI